MKICKFYIPIRGEISSDIKITRRLHIFKIISRNSFVPLIGTRWPTLGVHKYESSIKLRDFIPLNDRVFYIRWTVVGLLSSE